MQDELRVRYGWCDYHAGNWRLQWRHTHSGRAVSEIPRCKSEGVGIRLVAPPVLK